MFKALAFAVAGLEAAAAATCDMSQLNKRVKQSYNKVIVDFAADSYNNIYAITRKTVKKPNTYSWHVEHSTDQGAWKDLEMSNPEKNIKSISIAKGGIHVLRGDDSTIYSYTGGAWSTVELNCADLVSKASGGSGMFYGIQCMTRPGKQPTPQKKQLFALQGSGKSYTWAIADSPVQQDAIFKQADISNVALAGKTPIVIVAKKPYQWSWARSSWEALDSKHGLKSLETAANGDLYAVSTTKVFGGKVDEEVLTNGLVLKYNRACNEWGYVEKSGAKKIQAITTKNDEKGKAINSALLMLTEAGELVCTEDFTIRLNLQRYNMNGNWWNEKGIKFAGLGWDKLCTSKELSSLPMLEAADNKRHDLTLAYTIIFGTLILVMQIFIFCQLNQKRNEVKLQNVRSTVIQQFDDSRASSSPIPQVDRSLDQAFAGERNPLFKN